MCKGIYQGGTSKICLHTEQTNVHTVPTEWTHVHIVPSKWTYVHTIPAKWTYVYIVHVPTEEQLLLGHESVL